VRVHHFLHSKMCVLLEDMYEAIKNSRMVRTLLL